VASFFSRFRSENPALVCPHQGQTGFPLSTRQVYNWKIFEIYLGPNEGLFINGNKMASETIWEIAIFFKNYLGNFPRISYIIFGYLRYISYGADRSLGNKSLKPMDVIEKNNSE